MDCLFCEVTKDKDKIIIENDAGAVIFDVNPISKGHCLVITKKHFENIVCLEQKDWNDLLDLIKKITKKLKEKFSPEGFNFISNMGSLASQAIFHFHLHIIPKYEKGKGFEWLIKK